MVEIEDLNTEPKTWILRLNGDGSTFDAVCTVVQKDDILIEAKGALSLVDDGASSILYEATEYFLSLGYKRLTFTHNGKTITRKLKVRK